MVGLRRCGAERSVRSMGCPICDGPFRRGGPHRRATASSGAGRRLYPATSCGVRPPQPVPGNRRLPYRSLPFAREHSCPAGGLSGRDLRSAPQFCPANLDICCTLRRRSHHELAFQRYAKRGQRRPPIRARPGRCQRAAHIPAARSPALPAHPSFVAPPST